VIAIVANTGNAQTQSEFRRSENAVLRSSHGYMSSRYEW
jgi:hypothetical protein